MSMRSIAGFLGPIALVFSGLGTATAQPRPTGMADARIAGAWVLDTQASDVAPTGRDSGSDAGGYGGHHGPGRVGGGMMGMPGGRPGSGEGRPDEEQRKRQRELARELMEPPRRLVIVLGDGVVSFTDEDGRTQRFATTGQKEKHQLDAGTIETKTRWNGQQLVREITAGSGLRVTETYAFLADSGQLQVTVKPEHDRMQSPGHSFTRIYDSAAQE